MGIPFKTGNQFRCLLARLLSLKFLLGGIVMAYAQPLDFKASISDSTPGIGEEVTVTFEIGSPTDLYTIAFDLDYPTNLFSYLNCSEGTALNSDGQPTTFLYSVNETSGKVIIAISRLNPAPTVSYTGYRPCAEIRFRAINGGVFSITASNVGFMDNNGHSLDFTQTGIPVTGTIPSDNNPPVISPDLPETISFDEDAPAAFDLSGYFSDIEDDQNNIPLVAGVEQSTINGSLIQTATFSDHVLQITPVANASGSDGITIVLTDSYGDHASREITVSITAVNDRPVITGQRSIVIEEESSYTIVLSDLTVIDPDNTWPDDFSLSVGSGSHCAVNGNTITPEDDFNGELHIPVTVSDGNLASEPFSMTVTVAEVNDPPLIENWTPEETTLNVEIGSTVTFSVSVSDKDNTPTVTWTQDGVSTGSTIEFAVAGAHTVIATASDGNTSVSHFWEINIYVPDNTKPVITGQTPLSTAEETAMTISLSDLTVEDDDNDYPDDFSLSVQDGSNYTVSGTTITPATDFNGDLTVPVTVNDGNSSSDPFSLTVSVTPVNDRPEITGQRSITIDEESSYTVVLSDLTVTDPDNTWPDDFSLSVGDGDHYTVSGNVITPENDYNGELHVPVTVNDGTITSESYSMTITVGAVNDPPVIEEYSPETDTVRIKIGTTVTFSATITDNDDTPTIEWTLNRVSTGQTIEFDSVGTDSVVVTASDGVNSCSRTWIVMVEAYPTGDAVPVALNENCDALIEYTDGTRIIFHLNSEDCAGDTVIFDYTGQTTSDLLPDAEGLFFAIDGNFTEPFDAQITVSKPSITDEMAIGYYDGTAWIVPDTFETTVPHVNSSKLTSFGQCAVVDRSAFDASIHRLRQSTIPEKYSLTVLNHGRILLRIPGNARGKNRGVLTVSDMQGRSVETINMTTVKPGIHQIILRNCSANAMYLVQFVSEEFCCVIKYYHLQ